MYLFYREFIIKYNVIINNKIGKLYRYYSDSRDDPLGEKSSCVPERRSFCLINFAFETQRLIY